MNIWRWTHETWRITVKIIITNVLESGNSSLSFQKSSNIPEK